MSSPVRKDWIDVAKGLCILLVVLYHVVDKYFLISFSMPGRVADAWTAVIMGLVPLRMPLFFLISGFLASRSIKRTWGAVLGRRVFSPYYLYLAWLVIHAIWFDFAPDLAGEHAVLSSPQAFALNVFLGLTSLWYLYALAAYFLIVKCLRRAPWVALFLGAAANVVVQAGWLHLDGQGAALLENLIFFAIGSTFPHAVKAVARSRYRIAIGAAAALCLATTLAAKRALDADHLPGLLLFLSLLACVAGVALASVAAERRLPGTRTLATLGRHTLPTYVMHLILLSCLSVLTAHLGLSVLPLGMVGVAVYPIIVTFAITAACLGIEHCLKRVRLGFLFNAPGVISGAFAGKTGVVATPGTDRAPSLEIDPDSEEQIRA